MGYAWLASRTLHTGLKRLERFACIVGNRASYRCVDQPAGLRFVFDHGRDDGPIAHLITDFTLSMLLDMCRTNFGSRLNFVTLRLGRSEPADPQPWLRLFGCDVEFGAVEDSFLLDRDTADRPLPTANIPLANTFDKILTEQLAHLFDGDIVSRCKTHLLRQLTSGTPSAQDAGTALGMSQRTLQRKLGEQGLTYQGLCDETRHELARRYLDDTSKSVTEITFLLILLGLFRAGGFDRGGRSRRRPGQNAGRSPAADRWSSDHRRRVVRRMRIVRSRSSERPIGQRPALLAKTSSPTRQPWTLLNRMTSSSATPMPTTALPSGRRARWAG